MSTRSDFRIESQPKTDVERQLTVRLPYKSYQELVIILSTDLLASLFS